MDPSPRTILIWFCIAALSVGLLVGGLIGHFATLKDATPKDAPTSTQAPQDMAAENRNTLFDKTSAKNIEHNLRDLSHAPHLAGTQENNVIGDWIEEKWKEFGFETFRETYNVLLSYPGDENNRNKAQVLDTNGSVSYTCQTEERKLDPDQNHSKVIPPFNAFAKSDTVESSTVFYVNYCRKEDFEEVAENYQTVDFKGSIIICRYGKIFRGNKVKLAEEQGAIGVILYNDPFDYAPSKYTNATYEDTFPNSPYLPPSGAQRGSLAGYPKGDALTPLFPAKDYVTRFSVEETREDGLLPNIPTQPMGYGDAEHFLKLLSDIPDSPDVPEGWAGEIKGIIYKIGGELQNQRKIKIINHNEEIRSDVTNVFGVIKGSVEPDRYVLAGNHYDAWMFGSTDPLSGTVTLHETTHAFSELLKTGWRPRRSIIFCAWDAEESGIIGSTEWMEDVGAFLQQRAVAYVNIDSAVMYNELVAISSSPLMRDMLHESAKTVPHPDERYNNLYEAWQASNVDEYDSKPKTFDLPSGSDHTAFFHTNGITSAAMAYCWQNFNDWYPLYHTVYETYKNVKLFIDPDFSYHQTVSRFASEIVRALSDSVIIPFTTKPYGVRMKQIYKSLKTNVWDDLNKKGLTGSLDYLERAIDKFTLIAEGFDERIKSTDMSDELLIRRVNDQLLSLERAFLFPLGVHNRKSIRHAVSAPSATNVYGSTGFAGIGDALADVTGPDDRAGWNSVKVELNKAILVVESACRFLSDLDEGKFW